MEGQACDHIRGCCRCVLSWAAVLRCWAAAGRGQSAAAQSCVLSRSVCLPVFARWAASAASSCLWSWVTPTTTITRRVPSPQPSAVSPKCSAIGLWSNPHFGLLGWQQASMPRGQEGWRQQEVWCAQVPIPSWVAISAASAVPLPPAAGQRALGFVLGNQVGRCCRQCCTCMFCRRAACLCCCAALQTRFEKQAVLVTLRCCCLCYRA